jgi:hypothetical protein
MKRSNRARWIGAIALGVMVLLTLVAAPSTSNLNSGSTYSRAPEGYGAWYAFMQQRGTPVQRWRQPFNVLPGTPPITLLRINSKLSQPRLAQVEQDWVEKGNYLIILGVQERVSDADYSTMQRSSAGAVKIDTRRRRQIKEEISLGDRFGAVVWEQELGKGRVIFSTTPHIAANAYQDYPSNFTYLAELVRQRGNSIWVDEYIHGYKDLAVRKSEAERNWVTYLAHTPLFSALLQGSILLLVLIWALNQRFGAPLPLEAPVVDNSEAYIQALAGVLQKADKSEFVLDVVGKEEQMQLQQALGLGQFPLDHNTLVDVWVQQTGASGAELEQLLQQSQKRRMSQRELLTWLRKWQTIRCQLRSEE